jgi:hypothetical protein
MPYFTCVATIKESICLKKIEAGDAASAIRKAVPKLPYDDGASPFDVELEWLMQVSNGEAVVTMHFIGQRKNTWLFHEFEFIRKAGASVASGFDHKQSF